MTATGVPATGRAAAENELLAELGLPPSASPEEVDRAHQVVSDYLASAPSGIRGWAHARSAALDAAYLQLTDPVGFGGSALRSPTRPPRVDPGGPATPPARRDSVPADPTHDVDEADEVPADDMSGTDFDSLYAAVTPSAHSDMGPEAQPKRTRKEGPAPQASTAATADEAATLTAPIPASNGIWKRVALAGAAVVAVVAIAVGVNAVVNGTPADATGSDGTTAQATAPAIDQAKVSSLMEQYQANPEDTSVLLALADEFYAGQEYDKAATWLDKLLALEPEDVQALLARGAVSFNLGDLPAAETTWNKVVAIAPDNAEVHYDLGFLYLNQTTPDWVGVQREWTLVVKLDPGSDLATTVQSHLDALAAASMLPASPAASGTTAGESPAATPAGSPAASPAQSPQP
jgi:thioredoxin-like negative regulator of GroEL